MVFVGLLLQPIETIHAILLSLCRSLSSCANGVEHANAQDANSRHMFAAVFLQLDGWAQLLRAVYTTAPDDTHAIAVIAQMVRIGW